MTNTDTSSKPPTGEQLDMIRRVSAVALGHTEAAFERWGEPSTREEASDLLKTLDDLRNFAADDEVTDEPPRTCLTCGVEKQATDYRRRGRGLSRTCIACETSRGASPSNGARSVSTVSAITEDTAALEDLRDPRLSTLRKLQNIIDEAIVPGVTLDQTAMLFEVLAAARDRSDHGPV